MRQPGQECDNPQAKASWHSLFAFTAREDARSLATAIAASIFAGLIRPTSAIIFGQLFNTLTNYGAGSYDEKETLHRITTWCLALAALGAATWFLEWPFLSLWLLFGEIQAKSIRQQIFTRILEKNMEWYDLRRDGIGSLSTRIET
jgi:ATP-binding cassette subfamily B (MDR/TAP) protein 1